MYTALLLKGSIGNLFLRHNLKHSPVVETCSSFNIFTLSVVNPLKPSIKLQILLLCFHTFLTEVVWGEAVEISIEFNLSDHVLNSHDLTN